MEGEFELSKSSDVGSATISYLLVNSGTGHLNLSKGTHLGNSEALRLSQQVCVNTFSGSVF